jgi:hypothetical protein
MVDYCFEVFVSIVISQQISLIKKCALLHCPIFIGVCYTNVVLRHTLRRCSDDAKLESFEIDKVLGPFGCRPLYIAMMVWHSWVASNTPKATHVHLEAGLQPGLVSGDKDLATKLLSDKPYLVGVAVESTQPCTPPSGPGSAAPSQILSKL